MLCNKLMRSSTIRFFILAAAILMAVIIGLQLHWMSKIYAFHENEFNTSVVKSVRGMYEDLALDAVPSASLHTLVEKPGNNTWLFKIDTIPGRDSLSYYLASEFEDFNVFTDCKVAVYNEKEAVFHYQFYIPAAGSGTTADTLFNLPAIKKNYSYVYLFFPHRNRYILMQMQNWILASCLLLLLLIGFAAALYYFFKQKFLVEIQRDFIQNVTHEFSTPLSVIELATESMEKSVNPLQPERIQKNITSIQYQADYLKKHISNLINTVVADNYNMALQKSTVVPNELLKKAVAQLEPLLSKKSGSISWQLEAGNTSIQADAENIYLAFFNIISNAIKYSPSPAVEIKTDTEGNKYCIRIKDNGIGIDMAEQKNIFKKFYRVQDGNVHNVKGLGLGLYFTKKVIDGHHGAITINSRPGAGTAFTIELPLTPIKNGN